MVYPEVRRRPTVVTISTVLLLVFAGASLLSSALTATTIGAMSDAVRNVYSGTSINARDLDTAVSVVVGVVVAVVAVNVLLALGMAVLGLFNNRGSVPARIMTWVFGAFAVCCGAYGLIGNAANGFDLTGGSASASELEAQVAASYPGWYTPAVTSLAAISLLALLGAVVLLALPAAGDFFRKHPPPPWDAGRP